MLSKYKRSKTCDNYISHDDACVPDIQTPECIGLNETTLWTDNTDKNEKSRFPSQRKGKV